LRINATVVENKCNFLTFLLQQKLAPLMTIRNTNTGIPASARAQYPQSVLKFDIGDRSDFLRDRNYFIWIPRWS